MGTMDGGECPHGFEVDLCASDNNLEFLHLDHERPVHQTCAWWTRQLPAEPVSWDDGLDGGELCHALFGVDDDAAHGARCLRFPDASHRGPQRMQAYRGGAPSACPP